MSDDDDGGFAEALLTRVGMMMEDASVVALSSASDQLRLRVSKLKTAIKSMAVLMDAADSLGPE